MKYPTEPGRIRLLKNDREARLAEALRANLRRRKAFAGKTDTKPDSGGETGKALREETDG